MKTRLILAVPRVVRFGALGLVIGLIAAVIVSYRSNQYGFIHRAGDLYPEYRLSRHLTSVTENIHHLQSQGDRRLFLLTALRDELYSDGHHELKDVSLEVYAEDGRSNGLVHAEDCVYDQKQGLVIFKNQVTATTWQDISVKTDRLVYDQHTGVIRSDQPVEFERRNLTGKAVGVEVRTRRGSEQVILKRDVDVLLNPRTQPPQAQEAELIRIKCDSAYYLKPHSALHLVGHVETSQAAETLRADRMTAHFDGEYRLQKMLAEGQAAMQSDAEGGASQVRAETMEFSFDDAQRLVQAVAWGNAAAKVVEAHQLREIRAPRIEANFTPSDSSSSTVTRIVGDNGRVEVRFRPLGSPARDGRSDGWQSDLSASEEKTLRADWVEVSFRKETGELDRASASGMAVLVLAPQSSEKGCERKTIRADRMQIEFYEDGDLAKTFKAHGQVRVEFEPVGLEDTRETRVTTSQDLVAQIDRLTQDFVQLTQLGDFHFTEGDRRAKGEVAVYDADTHILSLHGGDPALWDSRGRLHAERIHINMETGETVAEEQVNTTYLTEPATNRSFPFQESGSPIFVAAQRAQIQHRLNMAVFMGRARAWQGDDHIMADRIEVFGKEEMMVASGRVRSGFYRASSRAEGGGTTESMPVLAQAQRMTYLGSNKLVRYEGHAKLKQGNNWLSADRITVFLKPNINEIEHAVAEERVTVFEPGRRAFGDRAVYTAVDQRVVLIGHPARVEDIRERLTQRGPRLTYFLGNDKVMAGEGGSSQRVRSVRRIQ